MKKNQLRVVESIRLRIIQTRGFSITPSTTHGIMSLPSIMPQEFALALKGVFDCQLQMRHFSPPENYLAEVESCRGKKSNCLSV